MAAGGPLKELFQEATCSNCLNFFRDPVTIVECGHHFCRACLTWCRGKLGAEASCPQCRGRAQEGTLRPNQQLANFVEIIKKLSPLEGKGAGGKWGACEKHQEPLEFFCKEDEAPLCVACRISKEHEDHELIPLEEAFQEKRVIVAARKGRVCQKHQEPLKLFCKDARALICVVCDRSKEHRDHETLPLEEASQEYKDRFYSCLEILKKERESILVYKGDVVQESQDLLKQTTGKKEEMVAKFRQLRTFLEEQDKLLLAQVEEVEKEVARNRDQHLAKLSEELSSLDSLIPEMEEKRQQPASELLQDVRSTLQRYEEKKVFENPETFPPALKQRILGFSDISVLLEGVMKEMKDTLDSRLWLEKVLSYKKSRLLWKERDLGCKKFLPEDQDVNKLTTDQKTEYTMGDKEPTFEELCKQLDKLLKANADNERIYDWIKINLSEQQVSSNIFIRALMTSVCRSAIASNNPYRIDSAVIKCRGKLLQIYLSDEGQELQALYALQALAVKLDKPGNLLQKLFEALYDEDIIKEEAFYKWESSKDPAEQQGKGAALKSVTAFYTWLRELEDESDDD